MSSNNGTEAKNVSSEKESKGGWQPRIRGLGDVLGNLLRAFRLVWQASPVATLVMMVATFIEGLAPPAQAWISKLIADRAIEQLQAGSELWDGFLIVFPLLALEFGLLFLDLVSVQVRGLVEQLLNSKLALHINLLLMRKALKLDLSYFEDAAFYDKLQNARRESDWRVLRIVRQSFGTLRHVITLVTFIIIIVRFTPWLIVILFAAVTPRFLAERRL